MTDGSLARLTDPRSPVYGVASAAAVTALALVEPRRLSVGGRLAYRAAIAGVTAWGVWAESRHAPEYLVSPLTRAGLTVGAAGLAFGVAEAGEAADARLADALSRRGVPRPRVALAAATGVASLASWWWGSRHADAADDPWLEVDDAVEFTDVPAETRLLALRLLSATDQWGAAALREQALGGAPRGVLLGQRPVPSAVRRAR
ncbi:hypothetical protein [Demequina litorisediminis]|uniref:Uncharacterized protein n=1 Tax=Demequina litorisediminis TaxID=1849022 RepID=A0ABQ6I9E1_9MICO|nr:hypothetical protein [Demequina litorisediminis]GMA34355.1 hypothetical protein GCM10025876_05590 [Demequina litorisediminis]